MGIEHALNSGSKVRSLAFSPDGSVIASGHADSVIRIWDAQAGRLQTERVGHAREIIDLSFSPDGKTLLSSAGDGAVRLWSAKLSNGYGVLYQRFETGSPHAKCNVSLSADGRRLAVGYYTELADCPDVFLWTLNPSD